MHKTIVLFSLSIAVLAGSVRAEEEPKADNKRKLTAAEKKTIAKIEQMGGQVMELAQNDSRLVVAYHLADKKVTDEFLAPLKDLKRTFELNLRGTAISNNGLAHLKNLSGLTRLNLAETQITGKGLVHLKGLSNLEYLNLYGTPVTDAGLVHLYGLKNLKKLFLYDTKVTDAGVAQLKKALPKTEVNRGFVTAVRKPVEAPKPKPAKANDKKK